MILEAQTRCPSNPLTVTCLRQPNHTYINSKVIKPVITSRQTQHLQSQSHAEQRLHVLGLLQGEST